MPYEEKEKVYLGSGNVEYYQKALQQSAAFRGEYKKRKGVVKASEMPWEDSPQGKLKHVINAEMNTTEPSLDIYQQVLASGECSGKHYHIAEEVFSSSKARAMTCTGMSSSTVRTSIRGNGKASHKSSSGRRAILFTSHP